MRRWMFTALAVALLCGSVPALGAGDAELAWRDWDEGLREARQRGRPLLVDVHTKWCGWCKRMHREVYARPDVRQYLLDKFVTIRLDAEAGDAATYQERSYTSRSLAAHFRVTGYPTTIFMRPTGQHLVSVPGYVEADKFLQLLRYIGDGHLERGVTWEEFSKGGKRRSRAAR